MGFLESESFSRCCHHYPLEFDLHVLLPKSVAMKQIDFYSKLSKFNKVFTLRLAPRVALEHEHEVHHRSTQLLYFLEASTTDCMSLLELNLTKGRHRPGQSIG